jgi:ABC-type uncharacterized transport system auxiliary subunit
MLMAAGCGVAGDKVPETRYFIIDYTVQPAKNAAPAIPVTVGVDKFRADSVYRTEKMVFRRVPYQVEFYPYERWGARPDEIVTDRMIDHLLATRRFREVIRSVSGARPDYLVRGRIKRFEEDDVSNQYFAVARIEISLIYRRTGQVLLQKLISGRTKAVSDPPGGFVDAMAKNLKGLLGSAAAQIAEAVARHHQKLANRP